MLNRTSLLLAAQGKRTNRGVTNCTRIRFDAQCSTGRMSQKRGHLRNASMNLPHECFCSPGLAVNPTISGTEPKSQQGGHQVHTNSLLRTMQQRAKEPTGGSPSAHTFALTHNAAQGERANRGVTKCTHIRFYAQCGTGRKSQQGGHQVHTHSLLRTIRHRA